MTGTYATTNMTNLSLLVGVTGPYSHSLPETLLSAGNVQSVQCFDSGTQFVSEPLLETWASNQCLWQPISDLMGSLYCIAP